MTTDEYPYLTQLSVPDRLRLAAYEARALGIPIVLLRAILDAAEELEVSAREAVVGVMSSLDYSTEVARSGLAFPSP